MKSINFQYLLSICLPPFKRTTVLLEWCSLAMNEVKFMYNDLKLFWSQKELEYTWNNQVIMMEHLLNDEFDPLLRRITIDDAEHPTQYYLFRRSEVVADEKYLFRRTETTEQMTDGAYLYRRSEITNQAHFIVYVPADVIVTNRLHELVIKYKTTAKNYQITIV